MASCKRHHVDPFAYLKDVLERLASHPTDRLGELLPDVWSEAHPQARRKVAS
ncbi:transposase domain-containing protein [Singulisphaera sp. Ch08]|uniref:transposase domain-containing protein n=1 Tax=Singulisphaera sp. Ch08 TaxID=3120278 RepID=UPI003872BF8E